MLSYAQTKQVTQSLVQYNSARLYFKLLMRFANKYLKLNKTTNYVVNMAFKHIYLIEEHVKSIEFNHVLNIPPDFHIEISLKNMHLWLLLNRLKDFPENSTAQTLETYLCREFKSYVEKSINQIHIHRKSNFMADTNYFLETTRKVLNYHFRENKNTVNNPLIKLDALVWTNIFYEKIDRYDQRVYMVASYLLENYKYMKTRTMNDIEDYQIQFNAFAMPVDYKEILEAVNPPLTPEEFKIEREKTNNQEKKYRYDYESETPITLTDDYTVVERRKDKLVKKLRYIFRKYDDLDVMDYSFEKEAEYEKRLKDKEKYAWIGSRDSELKKTNELLSLEKLREIKEKVKAVRN